MKPRFFLMFIAAAATVAAGCGQRTALGPTLPSAAGDGHRQAARAIVWTQNQDVKIRLTDPPAAANRTVSVEGARGETVAFQVVVSAGGSPIDDVTPSVSDLRDGAGHTISAVQNVGLFREFYVDLTHRSDSAGSTGWFPDGLVPIGTDPYYREPRNGAPFSVAAGTNQPVWVDVAIPSNAVPGLYRGSAVIAAGKTRVATVPISLRVWNFTLPATSSLTTAFGLDTWGTYQGHYGSVWNTAKIRTLTNLYQAEALRHRISLYDNDVAGPAYQWSASHHRISYISWNLFDSTMRPDLDGTLAQASGARGTVAEIPNGNPNPPYATPGPNDEQYVALWKATSAHFRAQGWYDRNFYYDVDEPHSDYDYAVAAYRADLLHEADPGLRAMVTTSLDKRLIGKLNIWTPIVNELDSPGFPPPSAYAARQKLGEKVWFYHSDSSVSHGQWPDFFVDHGTNNTRIFAWMAWRYHLDGFLYYATTVTYTEYPNPWTNVYSFGDDGDGILFYPGRTSLIGGKHDIPCSSIRLKLIRAALQEYEYMELLHQRGQDAFLDGLIRSVVTKTDRWTHDPAALDRARAAMAAKLQ